MKKELTESVFTAGRNEPMDELGNDENTEYPYGDFLRESYRRTEASAKETLRVHLGNSIVFTGTWLEAEERELEEEELMEGELSASVFTVGCYIVRIAECLYMDDGSRDVRHMENVSAGQDKKAVDPKKEGQDIGWIRAVPYPAGKKSRMLTEISAQYTPGSRTAVDHWQSICTARGSHTWTERTGYIYAVKSSEKALDSQAALFVLARPAGCPQDAWQWYRFTPDNKAEECNMGGSGYSGAAAREP